MPSSFIAEESEQHICLWEKTGSSSVLEECSIIDREASGRFADTWIGGLLELELRKGHKKLVIALDPDNIVVGFLVYTVNSVTVDIQKLAVKENSRRQGIGRRLVLPVLQEGIKGRKSVVSLHVDVTNDPGSRLYLSLGFSVDRSIPDYYGTGQNANRMTCELNLETNAKLSNALS